MVWQDLLEIPYVEGGRDPERDGGVDCWGLARLYCARRGIVLPADPEEIFRELRAGNLWIRVAAPSCSSDVVILGRPAHVGVAVEPYRILSSVQAFRHPVVWPWSRWERIARSIYRHGASM